MDVDYSPQPARKKISFNDRYEILLSQIDSLRSDLQNLKEQRQLRKEETNVIRNEIKTEESVLKDLQKTKAKYEEFMEKYERNREQDNQALEEKQEELAKCQRRRKKYESTIKKLKRQIDEAEAEDSAEQRQEKMQTLTKQIEEEQKLKSSLKEQVSALQEKLNTIRADDTEDALLLLEAKLESERTATVQLQKSREELEAQIDAMDKVSKTSSIVNHAKSMDTDMDEVLHLVEESRVLIGKMNSIIARSYLKKMQLKRSRSYINISEKIASIGKSKFKNILSLAEDLLNEKQINEDTELPSMPEESPVNRYEEVKSTDIVFNPQRTHILGGTLPKIIEMLLYPQFQDEKLVKSFLITHSKYIPTEDVLEKLIECLNVTPDNNEQIQLKAKRVGDLMQIWVDFIPRDFQDKSVLSKAMDLLKYINMHDYSTDELHQNISRPPLRNRTIEDPPKPIIPKSSLLEDFDPLEIARQMSIIEYDIYSEIQPREFLNKKNNKHLSKFITRFNLVSNWVQYEVLKRDKIKERINMMKKFIRVAKSCRDLNNFNGILEILSGLNSSSVGRLKNTWKKVEMESSDTWTTYTGLQQLMDNNESFKLYRETLKVTSPPCIPHIGVFLKELTYIEETHFDNLNKRSEMINMDKCKKLAYVIREVLQYQSTPYNLAAEPKIQAYLSSHDLVPEDQLWKMSLVCEPRDEKKSKKQPIVKEIEVKKM